MSQKGFTVEMSGHVEHYMSGSKNPVRLCNTERGQIQTLNIQAVLSKDCL